MPKAGRRAADHNGAVPSLTREYSTAGRADCYHDSLRVRQYTERFAFPLSAQSLHLPANFQALRAADTAADHPHTEASAASPPEKRVSCCPMRRFHSSRYSGHLSLSMHPHPGEYDISTAGPRSSHNDVSIAALQDVPGTVLHKFQHSFLHPVRN